MGISRKHISGGSSRPNIKINIKNPQGNVSVTAGANKGRGSATGDGNLSKLSSKAKAQSSGKSSSHGSNISKLLGDL